MKNIQNHQPTDTPSTWNDASAKVKNHCDPTSEPEYPYYENSPYGLQWKVLNKNNKMLTEILNSESLNGVVREENNFLCQKKKSSKN